MKLHHNPLDGRRGFSLLIMMFGMILLALELFTGQARQLIGVARVQKEILEKLPTTDIPGRKPPTPEAGDQPGPAVENVEQKQTE